MVLSKVLGLDASLGQRKNALLTHDPNSRAEQLQAEGVTRHYSHGPEDHRRLMEALFAPMRPATPAGTGRRHPADCSCSRCRTRRAKRTTTKGEK